MSSDNVPRVGIRPSLKGFFQAKLSAQALSVLQLVPQISPRWRIRPECRKTFSPGCPSRRNLHSNMLFKPHTYPDLEYQRRRRVSFVGVSGVFCLFLVTFASCGLDTRGGHSVTAVGILPLAWELRVCSKPDPIGTSTGFVKGFRSTSKKKSTICHAQATFVSLLILIHFLV